jgi:hypothetical protein
VQFFNTFLIIFFSEIFFDIKNSFKFAVILIFSVMKKYFINKFNLPQWLLWCSFALTNAQNVGIGTTTPEVRLDVNGGVASKPASAAAAASITIPDNISTFYITNVAGAQANNLTGPTLVSEGHVLIINNKDDNVATFAGLYQIRPNTTSSFIYLGGQWVPFGEAPTNRLAWSLYGNIGTVPGTGTNQNFLGTRDNTNFIVATNVVERFRVLGVGNTIFNNNFNDYPGTNAVLKVNGTGDDTWAFISEHDMSGGALGMGDIVGTGGFSTDYNTLGWTYGVWGIGDLFAGSIGMGVVGEYGNFGAGVTGYSYYTNAANLAYPFLDDIGVLGHVNLTFGSTIETGGFFHSGQPVTKALFATQSMSQTSLLGAGPVAFNTANGLSEIFRMQHNGYTTNPTSRVYGNITLINAFTTPGTQTAGTMIGGQYQINGGVNNTGGGTSFKYGVYGVINSGTNNLTTASQVQSYGLVGFNNQNTTINGNGNAFTGSVLGITSGNITYTSGTGAAINTAVAGQNSAVPSGSNAFVSAVRGFTTTTTGTLINLTGVEGIVQAGGAFAGTFGWNAATTGVGPGLRGEANTYGTISQGTRNPGANDEVVGVYGIAANTTALSNDNSAKFGGLFEAAETGDYAYIGGLFRSGGVTTAYKVLGTGTVSTIVDNAQNKKVIMFAPESPEVLLQDYGKGQLINGKAHVTIDPDFAKNITGEIRVFVQLEGDCNGVYVTNKSNSGFDVIELAGGKSNVPFTYTIVGNRADVIAKNGEKITYSTLRFPEAPVRNVDPAVYQQASPAKLSVVTSMPEPQKSITDNDRDPKKEAEIKKQKQELFKNKTYKHKVIVEGHKSTEKNTEN